MLFTLKSISTISPRFAADGPTIESTVKSGFGELLFVQISNP